MASMNASLGYNQTTQPAQVSSGFMLRYLMAVVGIYLAVMTPVTITLAIRVAALAPDSKASSLGFILGVGALIAMVANPLLGQLSDLTRSRFGRRKPWVVGGMLVAVGALLGLGSAGSLMLVALYWWLTQIAINASLAALVAVIPDRIPKQQRGRLSALSGMSSNLAIFAGAAVINVVGTDDIWMFVVPGVLGLALVAVFAARYPEPEVAELPPKPFRPMAMLRNFLFDPRQHPDFSWAWLSRFLVQYGASVMMTYQVYYLMDVVGFSHVTVGKPVFVASLLMGGAIVVMSLLSGWLSDVTGCRKVFVFVASLVYAAGLALLMLGSSFAMFLAAILVSSCGLGIYLAVDQALVVDVLPSRAEDAAKNMGIFNISNVAPQSLAPATAPLFLAIGGGGNYGALFCAAAVIAVLGALAVIPIKGVR
ncbi:MFS transporter [Carnimonas bestiolae]|uniref:MFS transporter n=1 Tax=Carnimonas bestiolae TaxID=3402172 RepID=UPI003EDC1015